MAEFCLMPSIQSESHSFIQWQKLVNSSFSFSFWPNTDIRKHWASKKPSSLPLEHLDLLQVVDAVHEHSSKAPSWHVRAGQLEIYARSVSQAGQAIEHPLQSS